VKWAKLAIDWLRTPRFDPLDMTTTNRSVLAFNLSYLFERKEFLAEAMTALLTSVESGALPPPAIATYPLADVANAHRALESGQTVGKLVLETA
jgi:NADPH:quinone reductase-like Zn-dependent oxidoreductase